MIFSVDITESFGAIDCDNLGGLLSYVKLASVNGGCKSLDVELSNFVLNLIDEPVVSSLNRQSSTFLQDMTDEGFLIVEKANLCFEELKGYERLLSLTHKTHEPLIHEAFGEALSHGDKIYGMSCKSAYNPELLMHFAFISPCRIVLKFAESSCSYLESYEEFREEVPRLNLKATPPRPPIARLFDCNFFNAHTASNLEGGYMSYIESTHNRSLKFSTYKPKP